MYSIQSWWNFTPSAEMKKPEAKQHAEANIALRGPSRSIHFPNTAAEIPRNAIAMEKIHASGGCSQSWPGTCFVTPMTCVSGILNTLNAYAWPIDRCTASAAGGTSQRLNPGGAIECWRSRKPIVSKEADSPRSTRRVADGRGEERFVVTRA